ncbi:MAG: nucleotide exchange factor GrpE [bacterium]|nr:nucleotide exchange factor GrpE [bacterium]
MNEQKKQNPQKKEKEPNLPRLDEVYQEYLNGWKRCLADFENYKKEESGRVTKTRWSSKAEVCLEVIKVLDNFQRMNTCLPKEICENEWVKGVLMVENQLSTSLKEIGLEEIQALGEKFNPEFHEALQVVQAEGESETIIEVLEKGWLLDNKVLKPAKVKVSG